MHTKSANNVWFYRYCKFLIAYTVLIIAWGAWVRISGSGAGCGEHWPLCNGKAIPLGDGSKTWVEVSHRYSTAIFGVLIVLLCGFSYRVRSNNNLHRLGAYAVLLFTVFEALIGRSLVTEGLVDQDVSVARAVLMPPPLSKHFPAPFCRGAYDGERAIRYYSHCVPEANSPITH